MGAQTGRRALGDRWRDFGRAGLLAEFHGDERSPFRGELK